MIQSFLSIGVSIFVCIYLYLLFRALIFILILRFHDEDKVHALCEFHANGLHQTPQAACGSPHRTLCAPCSSVYCPTIDAVPFRHIWIDYSSPARMIWQMPHCEAPLLEILLPGCCCCVCTNVPNMNWVIFQQRKWGQLVFTPPLCSLVQHEPVGNFQSLEAHACTVRATDKASIGDSGGIGRKERRRLSKAGICAGGVASHGRQACVVAAALWEQLSGSHHVLSLDNLYHRQFRPLLVSDDVSLNCSVATVLAMLGPLIN